MFIQTQIKINNHKFNVRVSQIAHNQMNLLEITCTTNKQLFVYRSDEPFTYEDVSEMYQNFIMLAAGVRDEEVEHETSYLQ